MSSRLGAGILVPTMPDRDDRQDKQLATTSGGLGELFSGSITLPESVRLALSNAKAQATKRAYVSDWKIWFEWCANTRKSPVPAESVDVAEFLTLEAVDRKISTVIRRSAAIATLHRLAGFESPCKDALIKETIEGLKRMHADTPKNKSKALVDMVSQNLIRRVLRCCAMPHAGSNVIIQPLFTVPF